MKNLIVLGTILFSMTSFANHEKGNGGDICENKMITIANDIQQWLLKDEFKGIKLPKNLSEETYKSEMLKAVEGSLLSCTTDKILVGQAEKTCKNYVDASGTSRVKCNFDRFLKTEDREKYKLIHHEFAGVAKFESNNGKEESKYFISNQISDFLSQEISWKLSIKQAAENTQSYSCTSTTDKKKSLYISVGENIYVDYWGDKDLVTALIYDFRIENLSTPWMIENSDSNCHNNMCPSFSFDFNTKTLTVDLFENDEMGRYYEQVYHCEAFVKNN